jgi:hypothetical protein
MPTLAPGCNRRMSSKAGGTASMTEPPTLRRLAVCIASSLTFASVFRTP